VGGGTVGACAIDRAGHVAAATSTGGITFKRPGRVGDTPLPGCGTYADDQAGAASATGHGESIIRVTMSRSLIDRLRAGASAHEAAWGAVEELGARVAGTGGIICVDRAGRVGLAHNTARMSYGWATLDAPEPGTGVQVAK
jgi:beta-aspartyl-peptidase (threonine type)